MSKKLQGGKNHKAGMTPEGKYCVERKVGAQWYRHGHKSFDRAEDAQEHIDKGLKEISVLSEFYLFGKVWNKER